MGFITKLLDLAVGGFIAQTGDSKQVAEKTLLFPN